ncbi:hypothetical protein JXL83_07125 [candidate division WOR-3 bacterium]|nr:hypothetical protein [candidate division WOR-3 bacterium]
MKNKNKFIKEMLASFFVLAVAAPVNLFKCTLKRAEDGNGKRGENRNDHSRAASILSSQGWNEYKNMWRELDALIDYSHPDSGIAADRFIYIDMSSHEENLDKVLNAMNDMEKEGLITSFEIELLSNMIESRIKYMSGYIYMTRMVVPSIDINSDNLIKAIDAKTDTLFRLLDEEKISGSQFDSALDNIILKLEKYSKIQTAHQILNRWGWETPVDLYGVENEDFDVLKIIDMTYKRMDSLRNENLISDSVFDSYNVLYEKTKTDLLYLETILPFMDTLFRDLLSDE